MNPIAYAVVNKTPQRPNRYTKDSRDLHGTLPGLGPDGGDLFFYLFDFLHVAATLMVGDLSFKLGDLLLVLPVQWQQQRKEAIRNKIQRSKAFHKKKIESRSQNHAAHCSHPHRKHLLAESNLFFDGLLVLAHVVCRRERLACCLLFAKDDERLELFGFVRTIGMVMLIDFDELQNSRNMVSFGCLSHLRY